MSNDITLPVSPTTVEVVSEILASMAALSGVATDYNTGSQLRTQTESLGAVIEQQGIWTQAEAFQALVYSALSLFGIFPGRATPSSGSVTFSTSSAVSGGPGAPINVPIGSGTIAQTPGGVQFITTASTVLPIGSSGVSVTAQALVSGSAGNVAASGITQIVTGLSAPLYVTNPLAFGGGTDPTSPSQSLATFAATIGAIGLSSPGAIANAAIGVTAAGGETVLFSTLVEPWIQAGSGVGSGIAGWDLYIDNGTGTASTALIAAVNAKLNGALASGATNSGPIVGYRDAGVPYNIYAVQPTLAVVGISGVVPSSLSISAVSGAMVAAVNAYFTLPFGTPAEQGQLAAVAANSAQGSLSSFIITLSPVSGSPTETLTTSPSGRIVLSQLQMSLTT